MYRHHRHAHRTPRGTLNPAESCSAQNQVQAKESWPASEVRHYYAPSRRVLYPPCELAHAQAMMPASAVHRCTRCLCHELVLTDALEADGALFRTHLVLGTQLVRLLRPPLGTGRYCSQAITRIQFGTKRYYIRHHSSVWLLRGVGDSAHEGGVHVQLSAYPIGESIYTLLPCLRQSCLAVRIV